jgi:hypothetical protein
MADSKNMFPSNILNIGDYDSKQEFINFSCVQCEFICGLSLKSAEVGLMCNVIFQLMKLISTFIKAQYHNT